MLGHKVIKVSSCLPWNQRLVSRSGNSNLQILYDRPSVVQARAESNTATSETRKRPRTDPTAKRPSKVCDPYGQGGKPLSWREAENLKVTISSEWKFEYINEDVSLNGSGQRQYKNNDNQQGTSQSYPIAIIREFVHPDYISGSRFVQKIAAIAQMNDHYPSLRLDRRIVQKNWQVVSYCRCHTFVLGGLSMNDFHVAMLVDVELERSDTKNLIVEHVSN